MKIVKNLKLRTKLFSVICLTQEGVNVGIQKGCYTDRARQGSNISCCVLNELPTGQDFRAICFKL